MVKKTKKESCCAPITEGIGCCKVAALVSIDERGQMVLPKELREKAKIHTGDKFAVISCERNGKVCCISLVKADDFAATIKGMMGPMLKEIFK